MASITVDFHTHLLEKEVNPKNYWKAAKAKKLDAVATTEHFNEKPEKAYNLLKEAKPRGICLIPGMELSTSIGHVIAFGRNEGIYGIERLFKKGIEIGRVIAIAEKEGITLSIAHPWGLSYDSAAYILGEKKLYELVEGESIGIEAFNGMFGNVSSFFYASNWIRKPMNFFDFLEKSRLGRKTRLSRLGKKGKEKLDKKGREIIERCQKPYELAKKAGFATAGSDAHSPARIGTGVTKLKCGKKKAEAILEAVKDKRKVEWLGPNVRETEKGYEVDRIKIQRAEVISGLKYATKRAIMKKVGRKKGKEANS
jgi:hypothetical protein